MPLLDLTPYLMGDPSAAFRRAPTEQEMNRSQHHKLTWDYALSPSSKRFIGELFAAPQRKKRLLAVGHSIKKHSKPSAYHVIRHLRVYGMDGIMRKLDSGEYMVIRTK